MKTIHIFLIFILVAVLQLVIPTQMIFNQENIIETGKPYKFKTQPVDPSDPFKGKYIHLNYEADSFATTDSVWTRSEEVFVSIANDSLNFAKVINVTRQKPTNGDYVKAKVDWYSKYDKQLNFTFPFNEFYMNETKAYDAEIAHTKAQNDSKPNNTYALVYVRDGETVLDNVFINDIPIADYVE